MSEIQRYDSPVGYMDACGDGEYMKVSDLAPYVEARVKDAVEAERELLNRGELTMRFGHGGISCGVIKRGLAFGILFRVIQPAEIGQDLMAKDSPVDPDQPSVFLEFANAKSAAVLLECVSVLMGILCGLPGNNIAGVRKAQEKEQRS